MRQAQLGEDHSMALGSRGATARGLVASAFWFRAPARDSPPAIWIVRPRWTSLYAERWGKIFLDKR